MITVQWLFYFAHIRQVLLHKGYELVENDFKWFIFLVYTTMHYYHLNIDKLLEKAKNRYELEWWKRKSC